MRRHLFLCLAVVALIGCQNQTAVLDTGADDTARMAAAFAGHQSNIWVEAEGTVVRLLPDDLEGSRHQKFILQLSNGQTLLMSYNIDLVPRLASLAAGDRLRFRGEYEWNDKGGVVHWLHHDPAGRFPGGWIKYNGKVYR